MSKVKEVVEEKVVEVVEKVEEVVEEEEKSDIDYS